MRLRRSPSLGSCPPRAKALSRQEFLELALWGMAWSSLPVLAGLSAAPSEGEASYQRGAAAIFHRWYCRTFFNFDRFLTNIEQQYINQCMELMDDWAYTITPQISLSTMAYSHRVAGAKVNSSRLAHGSLKFREQVREDLERVLAQYHIKKQDIADYENIAGLGWDLENEHLKVYTFLADLRTSKDATLLDLQRQYDHLPHHLFGLTSYTFKEAVVVEKKLYLFSKEANLGVLPRGGEAPPFGNSVLHSTYMITTSRGLVPQLDLAYQRFDATNLSQLGQNIVRTYGQKKWPLDTIAYRDANHYTLYF